MPGNGFIALPDYQEYSTEEMKRHAAEFHAEARRRRTVREYSSRPVHAEGIPRKPRVLVELSIRAVQEFDVVGIRVPPRPRLSVDDVGENLLAGCVNDNFVVSEQVCLLRV
jgi:hypothetical protein